MDLTHLDECVDDANRSGSVKVIYTLQKAYSAVFRCGDFPSEYEEEVAAYVEKPKPYDKVDEWDYSPGDVTAVLLNYLPDLNFGLRFVVYSSSNMLEFRKSLLGRPCHKPVYLQKYHEAIGVFKDISSQLALSVQCHETRNAVVYAATGVLPKHSSNFVYVELAVSKHGKFVFR